MTQNAFCFVYCAFFALCAYVGDCVCTSVLPLVSTSELLNIFWLKLLLEVLLKVSWPFQFSWSLVVLTVYFHQEVLHKETLWTLNCSTDCSRAVCNFFFFSYQEQQLNIKDLKMWVFPSSCLGAFTTVSSLSHSSKFLLFALCLCKINVCIFVVIGYKCVAFLDLVNYFR